MPFPPPRHHRISLNDARIMTRRYRHMVAKDAVRAFCFPRSCYEKILAQPGCAGIRNYLGAHENDSINLIMVGVDSDMNDILHAPSTRSAVSESQGGYGEGEEDAEIMQDSYPCPVLCSGGSSLSED